MLSLGKTTTEPAPGPRGRRASVFWISRFFFVGVAASLIVLGLVWWRDRPLTLAEESLAAGDPKYAHFLLAKFLDRQPHHTRAMALQARVHVALGDPETAIALFDQAGGETAEDLQAWARALLMTEQWSLAVPLLERVVQLNPQDADALYELTASRVRLGMFEEALESARRFTRLKGNEARGHMFQGAILHDLGRNAEAAAAYEQVLQFDPEAELLQTPAADFYLRYGQTLLQLGKPKEALDPLKRSAAARESPPTA